MLKMLKKPLLIATATAAVGLATISTQATAGDPVLGALIGGGIGAAIGHNSNSRHGTGVGAVVGAVIGSSIASSAGHYDRGYYDNRGSYDNYGYYDNRGAYDSGYDSYNAPRAYYDSGYYAPRVYVAAAPVYYSGHSYGPRHGYERPRNHNRQHDGHRSSRVDHRNWR